MSSTHQRATKSVQSALRDRFGVELNEHGYASHLADVLIPGVEREDFERDLGEGAGKELETKFLAAHSSSQLAVNSFAPFRRRLGDLRVNGAGRWSSVRFEAQCNLWPRYKGTPAHLDVLLSSPDGALAIESKCTEYFTHKQARFSKSYHENITGERRGSVWFRELERLSKEPDAYRYLDAAQLVKHAFGLGHTYPERKVTLLYLYWEPENGVDFPEVRLHHDEVADFAAHVAGDSIAFASLCYLDLWREWSESGIAWLEDHAARLARRYRVRV